MKVHVQNALNYLELRNAFPAAAENEPLKVTKEQLSSALCCTPRNVKLVINKLTHLNWIQFMPGLGRGNFSTLQFTAAKEKVLLQLAKQQTEKGHFTEALDLIKKYGSDTDVKESFMDWVSGFFGYQVEEAGRVRVETLRLPIFRPINTLDPAEGFYAFDAHMIHQIFNTLVQYNRRERRVEPSLAHYWETNEDCSEWVFYLRKGVMFHHGKELTSRDAVFSFERMNPGNRAYHQNWLLEQVKDVHELDRYTLRIVLHKSNYLFLRYLCSTAASIVPADIYEQASEDLALHPVGTGPFRAVSHTMNLCLLEAFQAHFQGRPHLDRVEIWMMADMDTDLENQFKNRPAEGSRNLLAVHTGESNRLEPAVWNGKEVIISGSSMLTFNLNNNGPQRNIDIRKAIHHILQRETMVSELGSPRIFPSNGFQAALEKYVDPYNPIHAEQLLKNAGYQGETFKLATYEKHAPDAFWIKEQCAKHGVSMEVTIQTWKQMLDPEYVQTVDCILFEEILNNDEVSLLELYRSSASFIRSHAGASLCREIDSQVELLLQLPSEAARWEHFERIETMLKAEYAVLFLVHKKLNTSFHPSLRGVTLNDYGWVDFKSVWFQPENVRVEITYE